MKNYEKELLKEWKVITTNTKKEKKEKNKEVSKKNIDSKKIYEINQNRTLLGVICGLIINFFALLIAYKYYEEDSEERRTFLIGWGIGIGILLLALIVLAITFIIIALNKDGGKRMFEPY